MPTLNDMHEDVLFEVISQLDCVSVAYFLSTCKRLSQFKKTDRFGQNTLLSTTYHK